MSDKLGRRIARKENEAIVEKYLWQGMAKLLAIYETSDNLLAQFEHGDDRVPVAMTKAEAVYYLAYDQGGFASRCGQCWQHRNGD